MALDGPQLVYTRNEEDPVLVRALELAREVEDLLEATSTSTSPPVRDPSVRSTRIVRAIAASLVDELEALVSGKRRSGVA